MKLLFASLLALASAYDASGASWFDTDCKGRFGLFGRECAYWMRCTTDGKPDAATTRKACGGADLEYTKGKCWAKKFRGIFRGGNQLCHELAKQHCPRGSARDYSCSKD